MTSQIVQMHVKSIIFELMIKQTYKTDSKTIIPIKNARNIWKKSKLLLTILFPTHTPTPIQQLFKQLKLDSSDDSPCFQYVTFLPTRKRAKILADFYEVGAVLQAAILE